MREGSSRLREEALLRAGGAEQGMGCAAKVDT